MVFQSCKCKLEFVCHIPSRESLSQLFIPLTPRRTTCNQQTTLFLDIPNSNSPLTNTFLLLSIQKCKISYLVSHVTVECISTRQCTRQSDTRRYLLLKMGDFHKKLLNKKLKCDLYIFNSTKVAVLGLVLMFYLE